MNKSAVTHHAYDIFCYPLDEDRLRISLQTGKDIDSVSLVWCDPFSDRLPKDEPMSKSKKINITKKKETQSHFLWNITINPPFKRCRYYFELCCGEDFFLFFEDGVYPASENPDTHIQFIFPWMNKADICTVPAWAEKTIWYQIFPARFAYGENPTCNQKILSWASPDTPVKNEEHYGGNLRGITEHLDYLHNLGITGLYLNPVNLALSQHKYDTSDYMQIDPEFGTNADMKELVEKAHEYGMRVMLDGVFNHTGWNFFAWQDILKNKEKSPYSDWYCINNFNFASVPADSAKQGKFFSFAFTDKMPKLNTNNPEVRAYMINVCKAWVQNYGIDAIRLDVANELSHALCKELRAAMKSLRPDFFIVGEVWNHAMPWLRGDEFDSVINYPLRSAIQSFAKDKTQSTKDLELHLNHCLSLYYEQTERVLLNQLDSHDTPRLATTAGTNETALQELALLFALPGSVCLYYGTEVLLQGEQDPDCRRCMPWKEIDAGNYKTQLSFIKELINLRKTNLAMSSFNIRFIHDKENPRVVQLIKTDETIKKQIYVILNFNKKPFTLQNEFQGQEILLSQNCTNATVYANGIGIITKDLC